MGLRRDGGRTVTAVLAVLATVCLWIWGPDVPEGMYRRSGIKYVRGIVKDVLSEDLVDSPYPGAEREGVQNLRVALSDGDTVEVQNVLSTLHAVRARKGSHIVVTKDAPPGVRPYYTVYAFDRSRGLLGIGGIFLLILFAVGGWKGLASALSIVLTGIWMIRWMIPLMALGASPILVVSALVAMATALTVILLHGWSKRTAIVTVVTLGGTLMACLLFVLFSKMVFVNGFQTDEAEALLMLSQETGLDVRGLFFAGTMIVSLGAVMDISVSLLSALKELSMSEAAPGRKALFQSGMRMGRDMCATMANTLIFALIGGSLMGLMVLVAYGVDPVGFLHSDWIANEAATGISATCGVVMTVPLASAAGASFFGKHRRVEKRRRRLDTHFIKKI